MGVCQESQSGAQDALGVQVDDLGTEVRIRACCQRGEHQQCVERTAPVTGLTLGVNWFNALTVGVLGVPGLGLLLLVKWVLV